MIDKVKWESFNYYEQMGNIASELSRAINFKKKNDVNYMNSSLLRLIELIDLTIEDNKNSKRLREICRFKEVVCDWYSKTNVYDINPESLLNYTMDFALLARKQKLFNTEIMIEII